MAHLSPTGAWLRVNARLCSFLGCDATELLGRRFQELTHPDDLATDLVQRCRLYAGELDSYTLQKRYLHKDGRVVWGRLSVSLERDELGAPFYVIAVIEDITAQKAAEQARDAAEAVLRAREAQAQAEARLQARARAIAAEAEREARVRAGRLQALAAALSAARTPVEVARATLAVGCDALGLHRGAVFVVADPHGARDTLALVDAVGYPPATVASWQRIPNTPESLAGDVIARRVPIVMGRRAELIRRYPGMRRLLESTGFCGGAVYPLLVSGGEPHAPAIGMVAFHFDDERDLPTDDVEFLGALAQLCAQAFERARLFEAEQAARATAVAEREQLARLVDALPVMVTVYDPTFARSASGPIALNRAFVDTLGWSEQDAQAGDLMALCYPDPAVRESAAAHMSRPGSGWLELPTRARDGRTVPVLWGNVELAGARQVGVGVDLTGQKAAEAALVERTEAAEAARAAAVEANRAKSQFLANMSHELRTPLNAIAGHVQLMEMGLRGPVSAAQAESLSRVQRAQRHLLALINDVLNYAKIEAGKLSFDVRALELADVVREVVSIIEPQAQARGLRLELSLTTAADAPGPVWADHDKLVQTLLNLLSNAIKFTPAQQPTGEPGRIVVELATDPELPALAFLHVHDTGIGIPADRQAAIFDPFVQVRSGLTREHEGAGLGLAISRDLMRGMGGELQLRSVEGQGATFSLALRRVVTRTGERTDRRVRDDRRRDPERQRADERRRTRGQGVPVVPDRRTAH
jgi:PAS domain S-box-containing protein